MESSEADTHAHQAYPPTIRPATTADDDDDWSDDAIVSSLKPAARIAGQSPQGMPLWARRLSQRDKLLRVSAIALAVLVVLVFVITHLPAALPSSPGPGDPFRPVSALVAHPAAQLSASPWEQVALPPSHNVSWSFATVLSDPSTVFACATSSRVLANGAAQQAPVELWRSHDSGAHWQRLAISLAASACLIQAVSDTHGHVVVLAQGFTQKAATQGTCSSTSAFISRDGGDTWGAVRTQERFSAAGVTESCNFFLTPHHLYLWQVYGSGVNVATGLHAFLERSDDGATWIRADSGLNSDTIFYVTFLPGKSDDVVIASFPDQHGVLSGDTLWRSNDGGGQWQHLGDTEQYRALTVSQESPANRSDLASHLLYGLARLGIADRLYALRVLQSSDGQHWAALPALPVAGANPDHIGVLEALGIASGGKLLFLGADPRAGIPHAGSDTSTWRGDTQWLWAWDPHAQRWENSEKPLQVPWPATCAQGCWQSSLAWGAGPDGAGYGTYVWVRRTGDTTIYRTFLPAT